MDYPCPENTPPHNSSSSSSSSAQQQPASKILGKNANGNEVMTSSPSNEAELQLYRVMQRASLLAYYDTLLEMGGDDLHQLCEAGEEEFLEIMALVGMASKPLHVRRLQKALQEWLTNPAMFRIPLNPGGFSPRPLATALAISPRPASTPVHPQLPKDTPPPASTSPALVDSGCPSGSPGGPSSGGPSPGPPGSPLQLPPILLEPQVTKLAEAAQHLVNTLPQLEPKSINAKKKMNKDLEQVLSMPEDDPRRMELIRKFAAIYGRFDCKRKPEKPLTLHEVSVNEAAAQICRYMPALLTRRNELFPLARQVVRDSGYHYSKGHSKSYSRSSYNNGDQPSSKRSRLDSFSLESEESLRKRQERLDQIADELRTVSDRTEGLLGTNGGAKVDNGIQNQVDALLARQQQLLQEQTQLVNQSLQPNRLYKQNSSGKISFADHDRFDTDDTDSQLSFSNDGSPLLDIGDSRDSMSRECDPSEHSPYKTSQIDTDDENHIREINEKGDKIKGDYEDTFYHENKVKVISSSGGNIIAVANPALSMSPAISLDGRALLKKDHLAIIEPKLV